MELLRQLLNVAYNFHNRNLTYQNKIHNEKCRPTRSEV